jgi:hypothetical protein
MDHDDFDETSRRLVAELLLEAGLLTEALTDMLAITLPPNAVDRAKKLEVLVSTASTASILIEAAARLDRTSV